MELKLNNYYNMDCMDGMKLIPDKYFDLAIVDPPYGRKEHGGKDRSRYVKQDNGKLTLVKSGDYKKKEWDNKPAGKEYFEELFRVSKHQIIWGENYFNEVFGPGRIIWDKCNDGTDQSDAEIAYNSLTDRVDIFRYMWRGMFQGKSITEGHVQQGDKSKNEKRIHPAQKPVNLYKWILKANAKTGWRIIDTHVGSASSLIACHKMGFEFMGFEDDIDYYRDSNKRLEEVRSQVSMFEII